MRTGFTESLIVTTRFAIWMLDKDLTVIPFDMEVLITSSFRYVSISLGGSYFSLGFSFAPDESLLAADNSFFMCARISFIRG